jgi:hypothetical protein
MMTVPHPLPPPHPTHLWAVWGVGERGEGWDYMYGPIPVTADQTKGLFCLQQIFIKTDANTEVIVPQNITRIYICYKMMDFQISDHWYSK